MSVSASHSRSAIQATELNGPRIAAISATLCVHITAFLFLMAPIAMPDWVVPSENQRRFHYRPGWQMPWQAPRRYLP